VELDRVGVEVAVVDLELWEELGDLEAEVGR